MGCGMRVAVRSAVHTRGVTFGDEGRMHDMLGAVGRNHACGERSDLTVITAAGTRRRSPRNVADSAPGKTSVPAPNRCGRRRQ
jgi:hypothetical protein